MKLNQILTSSILCFALLFASCSKSGEKAETKTPEKTEKTDNTSKMSGTMALDTDASVVKWKGVMLGIKEHTGNLKFTNGNIVMQDGKITGGSFVVDMNSIVFTDNNYNEEQTKEGLRGHLSSPDFFDFQNHPTAKFDIIGSDGNDVKGTLTIRGKNGAATVTNVKVSKMDDQAMISGTLNFDRKKYGVAFDMPVKEMVISDDVALQIELVTKS
ncbi:MAG: YceI family protein [Chitinophagales bacterium]|nr:YceI family protein [Chitinophagales bacterium]